MNNIQQLIHQLCPEGVEYKRLGEITIWDKRFSGVDRKMQPQIIHHKNVLANFMDKLVQDEGDVMLIDSGISKGARWTTAEKAKGYVNEGEIIAIPSGGTPNVKYYKGRFVTSGNIIACSSDDNILANKYLYYWMSANILSIAKYYRGGSIQHPSMRDILNLLIPLPPLPVQRAIAAVLDRFTQLETELETELQCRKKQYEYYRDSLLNFDNDNVQWVKLDELCEIRNGYTPSKKVSEYWENGTIPWFRMEDIRKNGRILSDSIQHITPEAVKNGKLFSANSIIVATTATIGEHALLIADALANQQFTNLTIRKSLSSSVDIKYFYYYMFIIDEWCKNNTNVSGFASVDMKKFKKVLIPLPSLSVQRRIVGILDRFEALTTSISEGLPAEIEARRRQYEYYRDRLLTFKRKEQ